MGARLFVLVCVCACFFSTSAFCKHPFGWRGDGSGRFPDATPPVKWSEKEHVKWSTQVGESFSSPVLTEKCVIVTAEPDSVVCLDRATGKQLWKARPELTDTKERDAAAAYEAPKDGTGISAATPVTDGENIFAVFANGVVCAFDLAGKQKWSAYIGAEQNTGYGRAASPLLAGGKLIVHMTNLYAFDPAGGKQLWVNEECESTYATPAAMKIGGGAEVIVTPAGDVVRVDSGKSVNSKLGRMNYPSPVVHDGVIYFADSAISAITLDEKFKDRELWSKIIGGEVIGSAVCEKNLLFMVNRRCELFAFEIAGEKKGQLAIDKRRLIPEPKEDDKTPATVTHASVTLAGKYLFVATSTGETIILEATPEAKEVGRVKMPRGTASSPIFAGKEMFLRDGDRLFCIGV